MTYRDTGKPNRPFVLANAINVALPSGCQVQPANLTATSFQLIISGTALAASTSYAFVYQTGIAI